MAAEAPRHLDDLPSLHLTRAEAEALSQLLSFTAGVLGAREGEGGDPWLQRSEELREIARELDRRTRQGHSEAMEALSAEQAERLFEATYGQPLHPDRARTAAQRREGHDER